MAVSYRKFGIHKTLDVYILCYIVERWYIAELVESWTKIPLTLLTGNVYSYAEFTVYHSHLPFTLPEEWNGALK